MIKVVGMLRFPKCNKSSCHQKQAKVSLNDDDLILADLTALAACPSCILSSSKIQMPKSLIVTILGGDATNFT